MRKSIMFGVMAAAAMLAGAGLSSGYVRAAATTLIENIDEPARHPWQETSGLVQLCNGGQSCLIGFKPIPAGHRLRITYVSCLFEVSDPNGVAAVFLLSTLRGTGGATAILPTSPNGNKAFVAASQEITLFVNAGDNPTVVVNTYTGGLSKTDSGCTIAGYLVAV
jgi:hypothetical protein